MTSSRRLPPPGAQLARLARLAVTAAAALVLLLAAPAAAAKPSSLSSGEGYGLLRALMSEKPKERREAARRLTEARDLSLVPGLVDAVFFIPKTARAEAFQVLEAVTGEKRGTRYLDWIELVGAHEEWRPKEGYLEWKAELFSKIDPRYPKVLYKGAPTRIRIEEIVSGGVGLEGIPALDRPATVPAAAADYLRDGEKVFGVSVGGERRAYPLRILDWHEMLNDVVGGRPVTLSYCTLCGSAVLYSTQTPSGKPYTFGTSGLLYRSNKLMVDRQTLTLWNNLTGEPAVGRLARSPIRLEVLPVATTTWKEWRTRHPETTVLALDAAMAGRWGYLYQPGAANRQRQGVSFPVWKKSDALDGKDEVFAVRLGELAKAYPVEAVLAERVINDRLGDTALVVVGDKESGAVRAYERGERTFKPGAGPDELIDGSGQRWRLGEEEVVPIAAPGAAIVPNAAPGAAEVQNGAPGGGSEAGVLRRIPGHLAFWFGWYAFFPSSELYGTPKEGAASGPGKE